MKTKILNYLRSFYNLYQIFQAVNEKKYSFSNRQKGIAMLKLC